MKDVMDDAVVVVVVAAGGAGGDGSRRSMVAGGWVYGEVARVDSISFPRSTSTEGGKSGCESDVKWMRCGDSSVSGSLLGGDARSLA